HPIASCAPNGLKDATTDHETIRRWWSRFPKANIATRTGIRRTVLDVDANAGGRENLAKLEAQHGALPTTATVLTGGGGEHRHFASGARLRKRPRRIARGGGNPGRSGLVLLPPSHPGGGGALSHGAL